MPLYKGRYFSRKETWITRIVFFICALIIFSVGPITSLIEILTKYQSMVYHYDKYQEVPGLSEIHVINVDLDMLRNGNVSMHCRGNVSNFAQG